MKPYIIVTGLGRIAATSNPARVTFIRASSYEPVRAGEPPNCRLPFALTIVLGAALTAALVWLPIMVLVGAL